MYEVTLIAPMETDANGVKAPTITFPFFEWRSEDDNPTDDKITVVALVEDHVLPAVKKEKTYTITNSVHRPDLDPPAPEPAPVAPASDLPG